MVMLYHISSKLPTLFFFLCFSFSFLGLFPPIYLSHYLLFCLSILYLAFFSFFFCCHSFHLFKPTFLCLSSLIPLSPSHLSYHPLPLFLSLSLFDSLYAPLPLYYFSIHPYWTHYKLLYFIKIMKSSNLEHHRVAI